MLNSGKIKSLDLKVYINGGSSLDLSAMVRFNIFSFPLGSQGLLLYA